MRKLATTEDIFLMGKLATVEHRQDNSCEENEESRN
jgi:hypothetical protein